MPKVNINGLNFDEIEEMEDSFEKDDETKKTKMRDDENRYKNTKRNKGRERNKAPKIKIKNRENTEEK